MQSTSEAIGFAASRSSLSASIRRRETNVNRSSFGVVILCSMLGTPFNPEIDMKGRLLVATILAPAALLGQSSESGTSLRLTDSKGITVVLAGAVIDYGAMLTKDLYAEGIRLKQGDGDVTVKWTAIDTIRVVTVEDENKKTEMLRLEIVLRNGKRQQATLAEKGRMLLVGRSDLGEYSVDLHKVRLIVPIR